jgi:hypothetical protein
MTATERVGFAALLEHVRVRRFKGNRKAAYTAAGVNAATWARAEGGESIKEHSIAKIVANLFPNTGGDWTKLRGPDGAWVLDYWDSNGIVQQYPGDTMENDLARTIAEEAGTPAILSWPNATVEAFQVRRRLTAIEETLADIAERLEVPGPRERRAKLPRLSDFISIESPEPVDKTGTLRSVAADEDYDVDPVDEGIETDRST